MLTVLKWLAIFAAVGFFLSIGKVATDMVQEAAAESYWKGAARRAEFEREPLNSFLARTAGHWRQADKRDSEGFLGVWDRGFSRDEFFAGGCLIVVKVDGQGRITKAEVSRKYSAF